MDLQVDLFISFPVLIPFYWAQSRYSTSSNTCALAEIPPAVPPSFEEVDLSKNCYWGHKPRRGEKSLLKLMYPTC